MHRSQGYATTENLFAHGTRPARTHVADPRARRDREERVGLKLDGLAALQHARPQLRPRQIDENGQRPLQPLGGGPHHLVLGRLTPSDSGGFFDWQGKAIPF